MTQEELDKFLDRLYPNIRLQDEDRNKITIDTIVRYKDVDGIWWDAKYEEEINKNTNKKTLVRRFHLAYMRIISVIYVNNAPDIEEMLRPAKHVRRSPIQMDLTEMLNSKLVVAS